MTKAELVGFMAKKAGIPKGKAEGALNAFTDACPDGIRNVQRQLPESPDGTESADRRADQNQGDEGP